MNIGKSRKLVNLRQTLPPFYEFTTRLVNVSVKPIGKWSKSVLYFQTYVNRNLTNIILYMLLSSYFGALDDIGKGYS